MKKLRFPLLAKIILFTGGLTLLTVATSLTINLKVSHKNKQDDYIESCATATDVIEGLFTNANDDEKQISDVATLLIENYRTIQKEYEELTEEQLEKYQKQTCTDLFGPLDDGMMGMTYEKSLRRSFYTTSIINLTNVCSNYGVPLSKVTLFDLQYNRSINICASNLSLLDNFGSIGYASIVSNEEQLEFFHSGETKKSFSDSNNVYTYSVIPVNKMNGEFICLVQAEYPLAEFNKSFQNQLATELIITFASSVFLVLLYVLFARIFLIKNFRKLTTSTETFVNNMKDGEKLEIIETNINSHDEIKDLSDEFMAMQTQMIEYVDSIKTAKDKEHQLNTEISIASKIQLESLPGHVFFDRNTEIRALIKPAKAVGGDFYDYFYIDENHLALVIADVSGKGIPASLFMMRAKERIKSAAYNEKDLSRVLFRVNNSLVTNNKEGYFVTAFVGVLDLTTYKLNYINAGHERPFIMHKGEVKQLSIKSNFVLGLEEDFVFEPESIQLSKGDEIFLHTDGLNEAINSNKEEYGYQRIQNVLNSDKEIKQKISDVLTDLDKFRGKEEQFDDITILAFKIREKILNIQIDNPDYNSITAVTDQVNDYLEDVDFEKMSKIGIIIDEAINNIISYGKAKTNKKINVQVEKNKDDIILAFIDNSHPFNPLLRKNVTVQDNLEAGIEGGLGISIIKNISKETEYSYTNNKNVLVIKM